MAISLQLSVVVLVNGVCVDVCGSHRHSIPGKERDGLASLSNKRALETCQTLLNSQFCFEAHISVVELEKYFEPSFKIIENNHSFSAADIGGPYGKVREPLHKPLHVVTFLNSRMRIHTDH